MRFVRWCAVALTMLSAAPAARAQEHPVTIGAAYQVLDFDDLFFPVGVNLDVTAAIAGRFAVVGEGGWSRNASEQFGLRDVTTAFDLAGGVRWILSRRRIAPFAQFVLGLERDRIDIERFGADTTTNLLVQPGAGVVVRTSARRQLFGQVDWRHVAERSDAANALRVLVGLRIGLD